MSVNLTPQSIQVAFLLCESIISLLCGIALLFMHHGKREKRIPMIIIMFSSAILLGADFCAYIFRGTPGLPNRIAVYVSNGLVYLLSDFIILAYSFYMYGTLWGKFGFKDTRPTKVRGHMIHIILVAGMVMVLLTQITGGYYYFDENNCYNRGPLFILSVIIPAVAMVLTLSIMLQYRRAVKTSTFIALVVFELMPGLALIIQYFCYGISLINICIGFGAICVFGEYILWQNNEITKATVTEVRTGLSNEHGCIEELKKIQQKGSASAYAVVSFDIIRFSLINSKYGMDIGTQVLINYAKTLEEHLSEGEFIGRQGSDHFIAVIRKVTLPDFLKLMDKCEVQFTFTDQFVDVSLSSISGIYQIKETDSDVEAIIANAYTALNYAKSVVKHNTFEMTDETIAKINEKKEYEGMLPEAIRKEEFLVYYQPKVNSRTKMLVGAEALVRWMHEGQLVSPGKFIPIMESNDLICTMDYYMLDHVCADLEKWVAAGLTPPTVSVNVSRRNLTNKNIAKDIDNIVLKHHIPKKLVEIEITETVDEFPLSVLKAFVDELHKLGYTVAVDDFGCGSSSLSLLREMTFDTLKIDKGFVDRAYAKDLTILGYIIKMAKAINLEILAEGVEQEEQIKTLQTLDCEVIQGYYFDKPLPHNDFEKRLTDRNYYKNRASKQI